MIFQTNFGNRSLHLRLIQYWSFYIVIEVSAIAALTVVHFLLLATHHESLNEEASIQNARDVRPISFVDAHNQMGKNCNHMKLAMLYRFTCIEVLHTRYQCNQ